MKFFGALFIIIGFFGVVLLMFSGCTTTKDLFQFFTPERISTTILDALLIITGSILYAAGEISSAIRDKKESREESS